MLNTIAAQGIPINTVALGVKGAALNLLKDISAASGGESVLVE